MQIYCTFPSMDITSDMWVERGAKQRVSELYQTQLNTECINFYLIQINIYNMWNKTIKFNVNSRFVEISLKRKISIDTFFLFLLNLIIIQYILGEQLHNCMMVIKGFWHPEVHITSQTGSGLPSVPSFRLHHWLETPTKPIVVSYVQSWYQKSLSIVDYFLSSNSSLKAYGEVHSWYTNLPRTSLFTNQWQLRVNF